VHMSPSDLTVCLKAQARSLGFDDVGIAPAVSPPGYADFLRWLAAGRQAGMGYMQRHAEQRSHPRSILEEVRSVVIVSLVYGCDDPAASPAGDTQGKIARYARGADYHSIMRRKLEALLGWLRSESAGANGRVVVDTAPLLERDFALTYDTPHEANHCGSCTRCLDACPTGAFAGPYQLDSRRCISYWTIEHRGMMPDEPAAQLHGWVFGCDICQDVCPWNRKAPAGRAAEFDARAEWTAPDLLDWLKRSKVEWNAILRESAPRRSRRAGLLRNAALLLGSRRLAKAAAPLAARLDDRDEDSLVRASAAWALGQIGDGEAAATLKRHLQDSDALVRDAVKRALLAAEAAS
jgi:epoxyqueuosine reductase